MSKRRLGSTELVVGRVGLGLAAVGRPAYINLGRERDLAGDRSPETMYARTAVLLDAAARAGVRYVDVARSYGRAEEFLARWLGRTGEAASDLTIGSKWGYRYTADWRMDADVHEHKELSVGRFREQLAESTALLGTRLDLYQIHSATIESGCLEDAALLGALVEGRRAGQYRAVGLTLSGPRSAETLDLALEARAGGERVFDAVQATFNVLEPSLSNGLARAHGEGLGVIVKESVANGRLTPANDRPDDAALVRTLTAVATGIGCTTDQLALAFVLAHPFVDVVLSGAATTEQLASHLAATTISLGAETHQSLTELAEPRARYWTTRAGLAWS